MSEQEKLPERKTLDDRAKMTDLERIRHSAAHVLATAILKIWPDAQFAAGPQVENGFYYDVELAHRIAPEDFAAIEAEMKKEIKANNTFEKVVVTREQALQDARDGRLAALGARPEASKFKLDIIEKIPADEPISFYRNGDFLDLCAGPHVMRTGNIGAFKLTHVASAYYKGDERNPQLQRIYGTAFKNKTEMDAWFTMIEEAKKRDHRKIGKEMGLFKIDSEFVGSGLPLWLPKGTAIVEELEKLAKETEFAAGYVRVKTPHIAKEKMYTTSGHLPYYADSMFPAIQTQLDPEDEKELEEIKKKAAILQTQVQNLGKMMEVAGPMAESHLNTSTALANAFPVLCKMAGLDLENPVVKDELAQMHSKFTTGTKQLQTTVEELKVAQKENVELQNQMPEMLKQVQEIQKRHEEVKGRGRFYLKAMNCPHHHRIFAAEPRSYRDLPLRLAEYGTCYRYEQSGELFGLMRVRSLNMNDAHIYCTPEQFAAEFNAVNEMYLKYFKIFGIEKYKMRFSTYTSEGLGKKYVDDVPMWVQTENMVRDVLKNSGINYVEVPNEAAFYGPKIDVQVWSAIGREFTIATNQVDFAVPAKFGLKYRDRDNSEKTPLCIHRAPLGTHERFIGFLIEHYAGNFPLWLAPEQVRVITIGDDEKLLSYAKSISDELRGNFVRCTMDFSSDPMKAKIAEAEKAKVHTMLVIGARDLEAGNISVRLHGKGNVGAKPKGEVVAEILSTIKERRA